MLLINSSRNNFQIQQGFSVIPGKSFGVNFRNLINNGNIPVVSGIVNSLIVSALSAGLAIYFSTLTAYGIFAYDFKLKKAAFAVILLIMTMPTQISAVGFVTQMDKWGLMDSLIPLFLPSIASPVVVFFMKQYMDSTLPMEIVEAARIDGSGEFHTFNSIVLPVMKPALAVQAIFTFVAAWNNYFIPALLINDAHKKTLPILIAQLRNADFLRFDLGQVYMLINISIIPIIIIYLFLSKYIVRGVALGSVKG
jgi:multiple sugar transport system permease protein